MNYFIGNEVKACDMCANADRSQKSTVFIWCNIYDKTVEKTVNCRYCKQRQDIPLGFYILNNQVVEIYEEKTLAGSTKKVRSKNDRAGYKLNLLKKSKYLKPLEYMAAG